MDDYSRFTWVKFVASKDEAPDFIIKFLKMIQVRLNRPVRNIRTDNGTELVNQTLRSYYESVAPQTMLIYAKAPLFLWAEAVATVCYTQNRSIILHRHGKPPYELLHDKKPDLSYLYVFGALCNPNNDSEDLGKLQAKADIGIFIGYAPKKKAYRIYNRHTRKIIETIHVDFDELTAMASEQLSLGLGLQSLTPTTSCSGLVPNPIPQQPCIPPPRDDWDRLFQPMFNEYFNTPTIDVSPVPVANAPRAVDLANSLVSTSIDQDAPSTSIPSTQEQEHSLIISQDTPMVEKSKLDEDLQGKPVDATIYHGMIGSLMYLTSSRPDFIYAVCLCACADHAGAGFCQDTRRSTSGSAQFLGDKLVSWSSKKQKSTAISSTEAEYIIPLYSNNKSVIALRCNNVQLSRAKHIDVRYHFIKEQVENGIVDLYFVRTEYQLADIFTKPLPRERFNFLIEKHDNALVALENRRVIGKCNMRINLGMKPKEPTYQDSGQEFDEPPTEEEALSFIRELGPSGEIKYVDHLHQPWRTFASIINKCLCGKIDNIDSKKQDKMFYPRFTKIIIHYFLTKDKSISMRNRMFMHTARDDSVLGIIRFVSKHADTQVYGAILPKAMTNQALLDSVAYKTYYAIASGVEPPKSRKSQKKSDSAISSEESPSKKKSTKAKKVAATKPKPTKKKAPVKADRGKGLNVLSEVALSEATQLKEVAKRSKKDFHISHASGSGDGTDFESRVPDEQHHKTSGTDEGTSTKLRVPDVPKYDSKSDKESWGNSGEEDDDDDDEDGTKDDEGNDGSDGNDGDDDNDGNDDDDEDDDTNNDDEETDSDRTKSNRIKIPILNQSSTKYYEEEEEEKIDDKEKMDEEEDGEVTKELHNDVNVNLGNRDTDMTDADQGGADQQNVSQESGFEQVEEDAHMTLLPVLDTQKTDEPVQSSSVSSNFTSKLLNLENPSLADNEIASLMDTTVRHEEPGSQTSPLYTILITTVPKITSVFTTTIPPPPPFFNSLPQPATPTPTPTNSEATTSFPSLLNLLSVFKFNDRVTNLKKYILEIKQVDQEAIQKAIMEHNLDYREEAQAEKRDYIELVDTSMRAILKEDSWQGLPLNQSRLIRRPSPVSEFDLTKILIDKTEKNKSYDKADYKRELYNALVKSYQTDKDLFDTYGEVFTLKRSETTETKIKTPPLDQTKGQKEGSQARKLSHLKI
ncbi:retrovirus-related pol polyprotein from transposon TNT 1-94 [Tanacetum coccineum]